MLCRLSYNKLIHSSRCDYSGNLGLSQVVDIFMDSADMHEDMLGIGRSDIAKKGLFWMVTKTAVRVNRMPKMGERVKVSTWPAKPRNISLDRFYTIEADGEFLVSGKTEWVMMDHSTGKMGKMDLLFPEDTEFCTDTPIEGQFSRILGAFPDEIYAKGLIKTTDLDVNGHMNNARYVNAIIDTFSAKELTEKPIKSLEILYKSEGYEGDSTEFRRRPSPDVSEGAEDIRIDSLGKTLALARIIR